MLEMLLAKLLGWIPAPWSGVRLDHEASARLCTIEHQIVGWLEDPTLRGPLHIDVTLKLWSKTEHRTTVRELKAAAGGQHLRSGGFRTMTLDGGGEPKEQTVELQAPKGEELAARAGDNVKVKLLLTRGRARKLKLRVAPENEDNSAEP